MSEDLEIRKWSRYDKAILWGITLLGVLNLIVGFLALGPDILSW